MRYTVFWRSSSPRKPARLYPWRWDRSVVPKRR